MEDTQDLIFEIEGNVGSVGSSDLLGVVSLVMTGGTEALHPVSYTHLTLPTN